MNYLEQLGLGDVCEDEDFFMYLMQHTCENGEVFRGYYGYYVWYRWFDILEFNCHIEPYGDSNRLRGFTSHISSNCFWNLAVADVQHKSQFNEEDDGESYILEREYDFVDPESDEMDESIHISLVNADVIPDYHSGALVTMQVSAIASEVSYYPDEASFTDNPITKIMGRPVLFPMNRAVNFLGSSIVTGEILSVRHYTFINRAKEEVPIYFIEVETQYGTLPVVHPASLVKEGQQEHIHPGAIISAVCDIQGDVAIGDYQHGAILDEEHLVSLLHACFVERDFTRLSRQLAEGCQYVNRDDEICAEGGQDVLAFLKGVMARQEEEHIPCYAWIGEVTGYELEPGEELADDLPPVGTHCIMLAQNEEHQLDGTLFLTLDEEGKIERIYSAGWKYAACQLTPISLLPDGGEGEEKDEQADFERIDKPRTESEYVDMLASAYKKGDFHEIVLYYSFALTCRLEREPANDFITYRVKDRESMYEHLTQNLPALPERSVQVIDGAPWGHEGALQVKSPKAELIVYLDLNEDGSIQTMHEIWQ